jgi:hypothetical protein
MRLDVQASRLKAVAIVSERLINSRATRGRFLWGPFRAFRKGVFVKRLHLRTIIWLALLACGGFVGETAAVHADESVGAGAPRAANDFAGQIMSDGRIGRVGIGTREPAATLEVYQGEIKLGSTGASCTKALAGAIRFADDQLWVCNSYGWRPLATSVPPK